MTKRELDEYIGNTDQLITYTEGKLENGVRVCEVQNGGNLSVTLLPDRCMDLYQVRYKGKNMNYISRAGIKPPAVHSMPDSTFLTNWFVGQMTTVGLQNIGVPKTAYGEEYGQHGRIDNTPAEEYRHQISYEEGEPVLTLEGTMHEAEIFGPDLELHRTIKFYYDKDEFSVHDVVKNNAFGPRQIVLLYHINFGYPLLQEGTKIMVDTKKITPRTEEAKRYVNSALQIEAPSYPYPERCYFHDLEEDEAGNSHYVIFNDKLKIGAEVTFPHEKLPYFCEWKMLGKGEYVLGMEPMNAFLDGGAAGTPECSGPVLNPGESIDYTLHFRYIDHIEG